MKPHDRKNISDRTIRKWPEGAGNPRNGQWPVQTVTAGDHATTTGYCPVGPTSAMGRIPTSSQTRRGHPGGERSRTDIAKARADARGRGRRAEFKPLSSLALSRYVLHAGKKLGDSTVPSGGERHEAP